jgi:hypothetical protein
MQRADSLMAYQEKPQVIGGSSGHHKVLTSLQSWATAMTWGGHLLAATPNNPCRCENSFVWLQMGLILLGIHLSHVTLHPTTTLLHKAHQHLHRSRTGNLQSPLKRYFFTYASSMECSCISKSKWLGYWHLTWLAAVPWFAYLCIFLVAQYDCPLQGC